MFRDQFNVANRYVERLLQNNDDTDMEAKAIAGIISSRLRIFVRPMSESEVYKLLGEMPSLKKHKAAMRHTIAKVIKSFVD